MAEQTRKLRSSKNEATFALNDIRNKYKRISAPDIEVFVPIYYPIAILEMNVEELTFEDFDTVQLAVLRFISLKQTDYRIIADLMGLSTNYVSKVLNLLKGYGHINDNGITELGIQSLMEEKKIIKANVLQKFQVDALNGQLITIDKTISENTLNDKNETSRIIGHLNYLDQISMESINEQLDAQNYSNFIKQKSGILNRNVLAINDVKCIDVKYAKCYMLKLQWNDETIVFAKRFNVNKKQIKDKFTWQPFSVANEQIRIRYGFEEEICISTPIAVQYTHSLMKLVNERGEKLDIEKEVYNTLKRAYPFDDKGLSEIEKSKTGTFVINVNEYAFTKYRAWIPNFLLGLQQDGEYIVTTEYLYGKLISIRTKSNLVLELSKLLYYKVSSGDKRKILDNLNDKFKDFEGNKDLILFNEIMKKLSNI